MCESEKARLIKLGRLILWQRSRRSLGCSSLWAEVWTIGTIVRSPTTNLFQLLFDFLSWSGAASSGVRDAGKLLTAQFTTPAPNKLPDRAVNIASVCSVDQFKPDNKPYRLSPFILLPLSPAIVLPTNYCAVSLSSLFNFYHCGLGKQAGKMQTPICLGTVLIKTVHFLFLLKGTANLNLISR